MEREYEVVIWGTRGGYSSLVMLCHCLCHRIRVIAVVANDRITGYIDGYPVVLPAELRGMAYDYILVPAGSDYYAVQSAIMNAAVSVQEKIVSQDVMMLPGFSFQKYQMLRLSRPTILARNCMGGYLYHQFKLQFLSPLINMFFPEEDFLRFASNLDKYLQSDLQLVDSRYNPGDRIWYPVFSLGGDVSIHMNHYRDFSQARKKWEVRKKRMNWDNLIFVFHTSKPEVLDEFQRLPFAKKICFVPFRTEIPCAYYLPTSLQSDRSRNAEWMALRVSDGTIPAYDLWDMLLYGKRTPRMSFLMAKQVDAEELVMTVEYTLQNGEKRLSRGGGYKRFRGKPGRWARPLRFLRENRWRRWSRSGAGISWASLDAG